MSTSTTVNLALELAIQLLSQAQRISTLVAATQAQGRTELTTEDWAAITADADASREALVEAIERAKAAGK